MIIEFEFICYNNHRNVVLSENDFLNGSLHITCTRNNFFD